MAARKSHLFFALVAFIATVFLFSGLPYTEFNWRLLEARGQYGQPEPVAPPVVAPPQPVDSDGDGLVDPSDGCPYVAGPIENGGCPWGDRDSDGFTDNVDACPDAPGGPKSANGCPPPLIDPLPDDAPCAVTTGNSVDNVRVRAESNLNSDVADALIANQPWVYVLDVSDDGEWYYISLSQYPDPIDTENAGWVAAWVVRLSGDCSKLGEEPPVTPSGPEVTAFDWNTTFADCPNLIPDLQKLPVHIALEIAASPNPCAAGAEQLSVLVFGPPPFDGLEASGLEGVIEECAGAAAALDSFLGRLASYDADLAGRLQSFITPQNRCPIGSAIQARVLPPLGDGVAQALIRGALLSLRRAFSVNDLYKIGAVVCLPSEDNATLQVVVDALNSTGVSASTLASMGGDMCRYLNGVINIPADALTVLVECEGDSGVIWVFTGQGPFNLYGDGNGLPLSLAAGKTLLPGPGYWQNLTITETTGDLETIELGTVGCPITETALNVAHGCEGNNLVLWPTNGDGPFTVTGNGSGLPFQTFAGPTTLPGPGAWTGVSVMEIGGDKEMTVIGDLSCPAKLQASLSCGNWFPSPLEITIQNGDGPFEISGNEPGLPVQVEAELSPDGGPVARVYKGSGIWTGITVTELGGDGESIPLGDITCPTGQAGFLYVDTNCDGNDLIIWPGSGDGPFEISGNGPGLPMQTMHQRTVLPGPGSWTGLAITETGGDHESKKLGDRSCPARLAVSVDCNGSTMGSCLGLKIQDGEGPLWVTGAGPRLPMEITYITPGSGYGAWEIICGPATWTGITVTEMGGDGESVYVTDSITCPSGPVSYSSVSADVRCVGDNLRIWPWAGGTDFNVLGSGPGLPLQAQFQEYVLPGPATWYGLQVADAAGAASPLDVGDITCPEPPPPIEPLDVDLHCGLFSTAGGLENTGANVVVLGGDSPFEVTGTGSGLPCQGDDSYFGYLNCDVEWPFVWTDVHITELGGDGETQALGDLICPRVSYAAQTLSTSAACSGDTLLVRVNNGSGPFEIAGSGPGLPQQVTGGAIALKGPAAWSSLTVSELTGDLQNEMLGNFACGAAMPPDKFCGDGIVDSPREECEPSLNAYCDATCHLEPACNNGRIDQGEDCEPPGQGQCDGACRLPDVQVTSRCGDLRIEAPEQCDPPDGNTCSSACQWIQECGPDCQGIQECGNGRLEFPETCEPPGQGQCDKNCQLTPVKPASVCGNGVLERGETCEPALDPVCGANCHYLPVCGNGILEDGEVCDPPDGVRCTDQCQPVPAVALLPADEAGAVNVQIPEAVEGGLLQAVLVGQASPADLYLLQGGELEQLTVNTPEDELFPALDPTARLLAYVAVPPDKPPVLKVMNLERHLAIPVLESSASMTVSQRPIAWSPDGTTLLVTLEDSSGMSGIYKLDMSQMPALGAPQLLVANAFAPAFAPNGRYVAFEREEEGHRRVFVTAIAAPLENAITDAGLTCYDPAFALDSIALFFTCEAEGQRALYRYDIDGIEEVNLGIEAVNNPAPGPGQGYLAFDDGSTIYFADDDGNEVAVMIQVPDVSLSQLAWPALHEQP